MEETLKVVNTMVEKGIIRGYAIGGGMAAAYYGEPTLTYDLDLFVYFTSEDDDLRLLEPVYKYLIDLGYEAVDEGIMIEGIMVQFLPPYNALIKDALDNAASVMYNETETKFISLEHLIAVMIQTSRPKDKLRLLNLLAIMKDPDSNANPDYNELDKILSDHDLKEKWDDFIEGK